MFYVGFYTVKLDNLFVNAVSTVRWQSQWPQQGNRWQCRTTGAEASRYMKTLVALCFQQFTVLSIHVTLAQPLWVVASCMSEETPNLGSLFRTIYFYCALRPSNYLSIVLC